MIMTASYLSLRFCLICTTAVDTSYLFLWVYLFSLDDLLPWKGALSSVLDTEHFFPGYLNVYPLLSCESSTLSHLRDMHGRGLSHLADSLNIVKEWISVYLYISQTCGRRQVLTSVWAVASWPGPH